MTTVHLDVWPSASVREGGIDAFTPMGYRLPMVVSISNSGTFGLEAPATFMLSALPLGSSTLPARFTRSSALPPGSSVIPEALGSTSFRQLPSRQPEEGPNPPRSKLG